MATSVYIRACFNFKSGIVYDYVKMGLIRDETVARDEEASAALDRADARIVSLR